MDLRAVGFLAEELGTAAFYISFFVVKFHVCKISSCSSFLMEFYNVVSK